MKRDRLLVWMAAMPVMIAALYRFGLPPLADWLLDVHVFDLRPYYPLLMSIYVMTAPGLIGTVIGFLLLDERDDRMLTALLVTPVPDVEYLAYRLAIPLASGFIVTIVGFHLIGLVPVPLFDLTAVSLLASFNAPITALALAGFAENKVTGFALVKILNAITMIPVVAFFVASDWQIVAGLVPTYWPMKMFWLAASGEGYLSYGFAGLAVNAVAAAMLLKRFHTVMHR
ncbi:MAG: hypothetical protein OXU79_16275 [Gemmatimonadota bacterium]|nr:hypothetical protein [Gemmatimonadota bacterium]